LEEADVLAIVHDRIDVAAVRAAVDDPGMGAVLLFEGVARDVFEGKRVLHLEYEAYVPMAQAELQRIAEEVCSRWPAVRLAVVHRTGKVEIGEPSVVIAVGSPHRAEAYEASRYAIDTLKARLPVWKKEIYEDGSAWKANTSG
jgi:molybdopterin synthase catalytic subunit